MANTESRALHQLLCGLSVTQLRSLNDFDLPWLPRLECTAPEQLATAICESIYRCNINREGEFLQKLACLYAWLIPQNAQGNSWLLYRRDGTSAWSEDMTLHRRFMGLINYPGCLMTHATFSSDSGLYTCIITTDPAIRPPDTHVVVCLSVWPGRPFLGFSSSGTITVERFYRALFWVLYGVPRELRIATFVTFEYMDTFVRTQQLS
ncbi:hypothetical protein MRX96_000485 [Rhipicephalus microplus]|uniref:Uncharacterized protein n=1 Tax=Rhipicephalus microplus TaxID=6941 RepID=A0A9J6EIS8_RHIMP|nr:hypothetical protein HPB51_021594 [Rhipicephalus microplus]